MAGMGNLIPLIILLVVVGGGGYIGYQMYLWSGEMKERANKHMEKKSIGFTKEGGLRVGVKGIDDESYKDRTQNVLVNVWNNAEQPNSKPRSGWSSDKKTSSSPGTTSRPGTSRTTSSSSAKASRPASSGATLSPMEPKGSQKRSTSPIPGGW